MRLFVILPILLLGCLPKLEYCEPGEEWGSKPCIVPAREPQPVFQVELPTTTINLDQVEIDTDTDADADADSDTDTDTDTGPLVDTAVPCQEEVFVLLDGSTATVCSSPNLLDPISAFEVSVVEPNPGVGSWTVASLHGWSVNDLGPSAVNWPLIGDYWSLVMLPGSPEGDPLDECLALTALVDPTLAYAVSVRVRNTSNFDNDVLLRLDASELGTFTVPANTAEMFVGIGVIEGAGGRADFELCSGTVQGGVNLTHFQVRELIAR